MFGILTHVLQSVTEQLISVLFALVAALQSGATPEHVHADQPESPQPEYRQVRVVTASEVNEAPVEPTTQPIRDSVPTVPFYSQFTDISDPNWKKIGCGIAGLAMIVDYHGNAVPVDTLLQEGIDASAYLENVGWTYAGLIAVSNDYGLDGASYDLAGQSMESAFSAFEQAVADGPVIASVYYTFTPGHPIPHLVVVNGITDGTVHYNEPAEPTGEGTISVADFKAAWKKRYIEFWPV